ncbi:MAG: AbiV family abortive infection protein [Nitrospinae bacterium]|nr:AbiV family abortive infection protein [Nitrospinota bacterium]
MTKSIDKTNSKQSKVKTIKKDNFLKSAAVCLANANRLILNAELLNGDADTVTTSYALAFLAQEEIAKAFLLYLIYSEALPWNQYIQRSLKDHTCKQLWFIVLDALNPDFDEYLEKIKKPGYMGLKNFINEVGDALNWYRYAKIYSWEQGYYDWSDNPFNENVKHIFKGKLDRKKQDALYVRIGKKGEVISEPGSIKKQDVDKAIDTAKRFYRFANNLIEKDFLSTHDEHIDWLKNTLKHIFTPPTETGREDTNSIPGIRFFEVSLPTVDVPRNKVTEKGISNRKWDGSIK